MADAMWTTIVSAPVRTKKPVKMCKNGPSCWHFTHGDRCFIGGRAAHFVESAPVAAAAATVSTKAEVVKSTIAPRDVFAAAAAADVGDALPVFTPVKAKTVALPAAPKRAAGGAGDASFADMMRRSKVLPVQDLSAAFDDAADYDRIKIGMSWGDIVSS